MTSATVGQLPLTSGAFGPGQEALSTPPRMDRRFAVVATVIGLHVLGLWALQAGLLRRAVELVVPVAVMADLIEPPQPQVTPEPTPPKPQPAPKPVAPVQRAVKQAPMPLAIPDPVPAPAAPTGVVSAPPEPPPAVTEPVAAAPVAPPAPPPAPLSLDVRDNFKDLPPPPYPTMSHRLNEQGAVRLDIRVEANGTASNVRVVRSSGFPRLDDAAVKAALRWRYIPRNGGAPTPGTYEYVIRFEIAD